MGAEECRIFAREGAKVVIADVSEDLGRQVEAEIAESGGDAVFMHLDVTSEDAWDAAVNATVERFGKVDILVNNAGISGTHHPDTMSTEAWDTFMDINAKGVFLGMKSVIPQMQAVGGGSIVNISSISGMVGRPGHIWGTTTSKGAVRIVTKSAAVQYAQDGIRVNSVHPGVMPPMRSSSAARNPETQSPLMDHVPMGRRGQTERWGMRCCSWRRMRRRTSRGRKLVVDGGLTAT